MIIKENNLDAKIQLNRSIIGVSQKWKKQDPWMLRENRSQEEIRGFLVDIREPTTESELETSKKKAKVDAKKK